MSRVGISSVGDFKNVENPSSMSEGVSVVDPQTNASREGPSKQISMSSVQETPKMPKASGLRGAILALIEKIKNFFRRAPNQSEERNKAEGTEFQEKLEQLEKELEQALAKNNQLAAENGRLKKNFTPSDSVSQGVPVAPAKEDTGLESLKQQLTGMSQKLADLMQQLAEKEQQLANVAQKPERNLMQELDNTPSTFIKPELLSLLRNELPTLATNPTAGVPIPPPPPAAPGGIPPPPPPPAVSRKGDVKILSGKSASKSGPNFLEVVSQCRNFLGKGYPIGERRVFDKKSFNLEVEKLKTEIRNKKAENEQNLEKIEGFQKRIREEVSGFLSNIAESPNLSAKEFSDLQQRYNATPELLLKEADKLKELKLMSNDRYGSLERIRQEVDEQKESLHKNLKTYLDESQAISKREKGINAFKLPLPDERKVPYLDEILQLLTLEKELKNKPEFRELLKGVQDYLNGKFPLEEPATPQQTATAKEETTGKETPATAKSKAIAALIQIGKDNNLSIPYDNPTRMQGLLLKLCKFNVEVQPLIKD